MNAEKDRRPLSSVKILVRDHALDLREFDVEQMTKATGCKRTSVQNEIRRMVEDGYLTKSSASGPHSRVGKPTVIYRLVDDQEKIERLVREIGRFRPARKMEQRPQSRNFQMARQFLDRAAVAESEGERVGLLNQAEKLLQIAWADEGQSQPIKDAFLQYEQGRLCSMKKDFELANRLLTKSAEAFAQFEGYDQEQTKSLQYLEANAVDEFLERHLAATIDFAPDYLRWQQGIPSRTCQPPAHTVRQLAEKLKNEYWHSTLQPLQLSLVRTLETVLGLYTPEHRLLGTAWDCVAIETADETPLRHQLWKRQPRNYCSVQYEPQPGGWTKVISKDRHPGRYIKRETEPEKCRIQLAVRGPLEPSDLISSMMRPIKVGKSRSSDIEDFSTRFSGDQ